MGRRAQLEPLTEPATQGEANSPFRQRGGRLRSGVAGLPPCVSWICYGENTSRELLCARQVVHARQHPAVPGIGLTQVGNPQQAVTAAYAIITAQHIQSPNPSEHGELARLDVIVQRGDEHRRGFIPLVIALRPAHGKRPVPAIRRPADETGERLMSNRTYRRNVAAQQDHWQGLDGGYELQEARHRSLCVEAVIPVQQDDCHRPPGRPDLLDETGQPFPEPPGLNGQDHQGGFVDRVPPRQRFPECRYVPVPDPGRVGENERHACRLLAHQPVVVVEERFRLGSGLRDIHGRIDQDPGYFRSQLGSLPTRHDDALICHCDRSQLINADGSAEIGKDSRCDAVQRQLRARHEGSDLQLRIPQDEQDARH